MVAGLDGGTSLNGAPLDRPADIVCGSRLTIGESELVVTQATVAALLEAAGLKRAAVTADDAAVLAAAGAVLRLLVEGVSAQLTARAHAKAELGADSVAPTPGGINPLKTMPPDQALAAMLDPGGCGTMSGTRAVMDALAELDAHNDATMAAMQGALAATLDHFSPASIRSRATAGGLVGRMLPAAREAALWHAYEREFDGDNRGSGDAFVELFASSFAQTYRENSGND